VTDGTVQAQQDKPAGDVLFVVSILPHERFERNIEHLFLDWNLTLVEALTGFNHSIEHLNGQNITIARQEITPPGFKMILEGRGMPRMVTSEQAADGTMCAGFGDLTITFSISFPFIPMRSKRVLRRMLREENGDGDDSDEG
jgi:DnaJ-related protein SCJ1